MRTIYGIGNILIIVIFMIKISCDNYNSYISCHGHKNDATKFPVLNTTTLTLFTRQIKLTI